jgi:hypothetical protein
MKKLNKKSAISKLGLLSVGAMLALSAFSSTSYALNYDYMPSHAERQEIAKERADRKAAAEAKAAAAAAECYAEGYDIVKTHGELKSEVLTIQAMFCLINPKTLNSLMDGADAAKVDAEEK